MLVCGGVSCFEQPAVYRLCCLTIRKKKMASRPVGDGRGGKIVELQQAIKELQQKLAIKEMQLKIETLQLEIETLQREIAPKTMPGGSHALRTPPPHPAGAATPSFDLATVEEEEEYLAAIAAAEARAIAAAEEARAIAAAEEEHLAYVRVFEEEQQHRARVRAAAVAEEERRARVLAEEEMVDHFARHSALETPPPANVTTPRQPVFEGAAGGRRRGRRRRRGRGGQRHGGQRHGEPSRFSIV